MAEIDWNQFKVAQPVDDKKNDIDWNQFQPAKVIQDNVLDINRPEADLGFFTHTKYSVDPLQTDRKALLVEQFGQDNVAENKEGDLFIRQNGQFLPVNQKGFSAADIADFAGALPEIAGTAFGGVGGFLGGGPVGAGVGAFVGGAAGSGIRQGLSAILGTPQEADLKERALETATSGAFSLLGAGAGSGLKMAAPVAKKGVQTVGKGIAKGLDYVTDIPGLKFAKDYAKTMYETSGVVLKNLEKNFSSGLAPDRKKYLDIALEHGIDPNILPEAVNYGKESIVSRAARNLSETPFGEERLRRFYQAQDQVTNAIDKSVHELAPKTLQGPIEAGEFVLDKFNQKAKEVLGNDEMTYKKIASEFPGLKLTVNSLEALDSKLNGLSKYAKGLMARGIGSQRREGAELLRAVNNLRNSKGSFKHTVESLQNIGKEAFTNDFSGKRLPVDKEKLKEIYFAYRDEIVNSINDIYGDYGQEVTNSLLENNKNISNFLKQKEVLGNIVEKNKVSPARIYKSVIGENNTNKLDVLKDILNPEDFQVIKKTLLQGMIKKNMDNRVLYKTTYNNIAKNKELISKYFSPDEIQGLSDLLDLGNRMGEPVLSSSGTGASIGFQNLIDNTKKAFSGEYGIEAMKKRAERITKEEAKSKTQGSIGKALKNSGAYGNLLKDEQQRDISRKKK